jgi:N-acetylglucosaminyl-diphospho-decaprenol L-rhamnosyltransferase
LTTVELSVVIVNWNTRELLAACLESVVRSQHDNRAGARTAVGRESERPQVGSQESGDFTLLPCPVTPEVFVVDNASADDSAAMVRKRFPWVRLIENRENVGFAQGNNQAIQQATGRYVLLLNPDTLVHSGALDALLSFLQTHPRAGAAGARLLNSDGTLQPACHPMLTPGREFWRLSFLDSILPRATYPMTRWDTATPRRVEVIKGACLLVRRAALDQVGVLDDSYFMYTEEVDLCYRLAEAGWELWYVPAAVVTHFGEASSRQAPEAMYLQLYRSKIQFYRKFGGERRARQAKLLLALAYAPRAAVVGAAALARSDRRTRARTYRRLLAALPSM